MAGPVVVAERGDVGDGRLGVGGAQRLRHGLRHLRRAQGDERRVVGEAAPLQPAEEAAQGREGAGGGAALQAGAGARGEPGAEIGGAQRPEVGKAGGPAAMEDRKSVVWGKSGSVRVGSGGCRTLQKKKYNK